jgi:hypothetical protein
MISTGITRPSARAEIPLTRLPLEDARLEIERILDPSKRPRAGERDVDADGLHARLRPGSRPDGRIHIHIDCFGHLTWP